jgi:hypothetical protein
MMPMSTASRNYQAFMSCTAEPGWLGEAQLQLGEWLREKKDLDLDLSDDVSLDIENRTIRFQHHRDGQSRSLRAQLIERATPTGTWTTDLVACDRRTGDGWVSVKVENDQERFVNIPRVARYLMQTLPLGDGRARYVDGPQLFRQDDVERLVALLRDEERHGLVLVAGTDNDLPFESFVKRMSVWTKEVYGLAQVIVLDPHATRAFNAVAESPYQAARWGIRSFFPGVDMTSPLDWRRHRILGPTRLGTMDDFRINRMLGSIARGHAAARQTPVEVTRAVRTFDRLANSALLKAIDPDVAPPLPQTIPPSKNDVASEAEGYLGQIELTKTILGVRNLDEATLQAIAHAAAGLRIEPAMLHTARQRIEEQQDQIEKLEDQLRVAACALDDDQEERQQIYEDLERVNAEIRWLRAQFKSRGDYEIAFGTVPEDWQEEYPESFGDLLDRLPGLANGRVQFTGDRDTAVSVDEYDTLQMAVRIAWEACRALEGYLRAREDRAWDSGVEPYLRRTVTLALHQGSMPRTKPGRR